MANKYYAEIFNHSGASYHQAMQLYPNARDEEFAAVHSLLDLPAKARVVDVPAGGGYLRSHLADDIVYLGLEFSKGFGVHERIDQSSESHLAIENASIDAAISLAALHHVEDKPGFFSELARIVKPSGQLIIADVCQQSAPAVFLNGFVDQWNKLGHQGDFIDPIRDANLLANAGFSCAFETRNYHWNFASKQQCREYMQLLFCLDKQPGANDLDSAIEQLGCKRTSSGFHLNWSLGCFVAKLA